MWAPIGDALRIPWKDAERLHWRLGKNGMAERAGAFGLAPPDEDNGEVHPHSNEEPDQSSHHLQFPQHQTEPAPMAHEGQPGSLLTPMVPGISEFVAGVEQLHRLGQRETHQHSDEEPDQSSHNVQYPLLPQYRTEPAPIAHEGQPGSLLTPTVPGISEFVAGVERLHRQAQRET
ncbi:hypothetical protein E4U32_006254 [Claviceps aff. humidiphila group G2b]|nr:hypothetical protein E4U32_006254 [Claviceps aff. humidiphila group G2b]